MPKISEEINRNNCLKTKLLIKIILRTLTRQFWQPCRKFLHTFQKCLAQCPLKHKKILFTLESNPSKSFSWPLKCSFDKLLRKTSPKDLKIFRRISKKFPKTFEIFNFLKKNAFAQNNSPEVQNVVFATLSSFFLQKSSKVSPKTRENLLKIRLSQPPYFFSSEFFPETRRLRFWQILWKFYTNSFEILHPKPIKVEQKFVLKKSFLKTILGQRKWSFDNHAWKLLSKVEKCFAQCLNLLI